MPSRLLAIFTSFILVTSMLPAAAIAVEEGEYEAAAEIASEESGAASNEENSGAELPGSGSSSEQEGEADTPADPVGPENPQVPETPEDPEDDESDVVEEERLVQEGERYRFLLSDGTYLTESWKDWEGKTYYFNKKGYAVTGKQKIKTSLYCFNKKGQVQSGWVTISGKVYYFSPKTHKALRYKQVISGKTYYFKADYTRYTGWVTWKADGRRSYFSPKNKGAAAKGWWTIGGKRYYFNPKTYKAVRYKQVISGKTYYFNAKGQMRTGWLTWKDGRKSYFNPKKKGAAAKGWWTLGGKRYYFNPKTCKSVRYKQVIGGKTYYFNAKSQMRTGWLKWKDGMHSYLGTNGVMRFGTHKINGRSFTFNSQGKTWAQRKLSVPCLMQYPELPNGCESVALTNVLNYKGFRLSKCTMADYWIPRSSWNFVTHFWGNPHSYSGNSIAAPGLTKAANKFLNAKGSKLNAYDVSGKSLRQLYSYVAKGHPVIVWATIGQQSIGPCYGVQYWNGKRYAVYTNSHTLVVRGFDRINNKVYLADSISGYVTCDASWFAMTYSARGSQAVVIK